MRQLEFLLGMRERHGDVFEIRSAGERNVLVVGDPELAEQVFRAPADVLRAGEASRRRLGWLLGEHSLILLDGEAHMAHRRLLLPALRGPRLKRHEAAVKAEIEARLDAWPSREEVAALPRMRELTLAVVTGALFADGGERELTALRAALAALGPGEARGERGERAVGRAIERAGELIGAVVAARRGDPPGGRGDVLSLLLEARHEDGAKLSDAEIRDELITLIVAGTETTAGSLAWALERLARNPVALARVAEDAADCGPYVDAAICETLRMRPTVPMTARRVKRPFRLGERLVAPGTTLAVSALLIHHRADLYPEPMAFRPDRFLGRPPGAYTWVPFGGGARRCIGAGFAQLEMRVVLSTLLSRVTPRAADPEPEEIRNRVNTMVPSRGGRVVFSPRRPRRSEAIRSHT